jgi:RNA polymerase sporulation-specific sigma factor
MLELLINLLGTRFLLFALHFEGEGKFPKPLTAAEERRCFERLSAGDRAARDELISHNLRLVAHIVKKYTASGADSDDLISIGTIGLIKAVETYDHTKGNRFASYGARCVENEILMHLRSAKKQAAEIRFDEPVDVDKNGNCLTLMDITPDEGMSVEESCVLRIQLDRLAEKLGTLDERERQIIVLRYGLGDSPPIAQREVAERLGISRSYVSRLEKKALETLRREME